MSIMEQDNSSMVQRVQWFPGHMAKTRRKITEDLKLVDIVMELLDARIPDSSSNPVLRDIIRNKPRVVVLNKSDLADPKQTGLWAAKYNEQGLRAIKVESKTGKGLPALYQAIREELKEQISGWERKGMTGRPVRVMVLGIPNVGKSSLLNILAGKERAIVTDVAGTTRDTLEETIVLGNITLNMIDTAGIRNTEDIVEKIGVEKARNISKEADLILYVIDASIPLDESDMDIIKMIVGKKAVILLNKSGLSITFNEDSITISSSNILVISIFLYLNSFKTPIILLCLANISSFI